MTPVCLAACMVHPKHDYVPNGVPIYDPDSGRDAISAIIDRFIHGDMGKQVEASKTYQDFRTKAGWILRQFICVFQKR